VHAAQLSRRGGKSICTIAERGLDHYYPALIRAKKGTRSGEKKARAQNKTVITTIT
jgi:hypothetical protein